MVPLQFLYQLNQYLQDALQREQLLESKLAALQNIMENTRQASDIGWKTLIDEDHLLSRVEILETQLQTYSNNFAEDKMRSEFVKLQEERNQYQGIAKEYLKKVLQEKVDVVQRLNNLEQALKNKEGECERLRRLKEQNSQDVSELAQKCSLQSQTVEDLSHKILKSEELRRESCENLEREKQELAAQLDEHVRIGRSMQDRIDAIIAGNVPNLKFRLHSPNRAMLDNAFGMRIGKQSDSIGTQVDVVLERIDPKLSDDMNGELERSHYHLKHSEEKLKEDDEYVEVLHIRLEELRKQESYSMELTQRLEERLLDLETQLREFESDVSNKTTQTDGTRRNQVSTLKADIKKLEKLLTKTRNKKQEAENEISRVQLELEGAKNKVTKCADEARELKHFLQSSPSLIGRDSSRALQLEENLKHLIAASSELKQQIIETEEKLEKETVKADHYANIAENLHKELIEVQQSMKQSHNEAAQLREKVFELEKESEARNRQAYDQLKQQCSTLQEESAQLRLEHWELLQRSSQLTDTNLTLHDKHEKLFQGFGGQTILKDLEDLQEKCKEADTAMTSLEEELRVVKERYINCNNEKNEIATQLSLFREQCKNASSPKYVPAYYLIVVIVILLISTVVIFVHR